MDKKPVAQVVGVDVATVHTWLANDEIVLVDVRETSEFDQEHIPGAMLLPMSTFDPELFPSVPGKKVVLHCAVGKRSESAGKMLLNEGYDGAIHMIGGIQEWKAAGYATEVQFVPPPGPQDAQGDKSMEAAKAPASAPAAPLSPSPGDVLMEEFMEPLGIDRAELAKDTGIAEEKIDAIIQDASPVSVEQSLRLARYFSTASDFWLHVQIEHDLEKVRRDIGTEIRRQVSPRTAKR